MNCEKCQELLSDFLDGAIGDDDRATFSAHLEECLPCFNMHAETNSIVTFCREHRGEYDAPPHERAMWLRILNTLESERLSIATSAQTLPRATQRDGWWSRLMGRSWELSLPQVAMAVIAIIVVASLATVFGLRGLQSNFTESNVASRNLNNTGAPTSALAYSNNGAKGLDVNNRLWQQQQQIKYWSQIVEERKAHWNPQVRADFEHNVQLLDESVQESLQRLSERPHDEVTEEMLNAALNDKMELLKEFSDL